MRNKMLLTLGLVAVIVLGTYWLAESQGKDESGKAAESGSIAVQSHNNGGDSNSAGAGTPSLTMDAQSIKQLVHGFSMRSITAESASISSTQLIVKEDETVSTTYDLPEDEFFVSIAPYINNTHPCAIHSLTGCQGELVEKEFYVTVIDPEGHPVLDKQAMKSQPNGFIDLWLPRDQTYQVTVEHDGKMAEAEISTFIEDDTCITTMQLG